MGQQLYPMTTRSSIPLFACFIVFYSMSQIAMGQDVKKVIKVTGNVGVYGDFYNMESDSLDAVSPRRPGTLGRLVVNSSIEFKDFTMPISLAIPTRQFGIMVPSVPQIPDAPIDNFKQLIKNPLNRVGIAPKYKWAQVLLGSQIPNYSELSVGDLAIFGMGINLTPGKFRFSYFTGISQLAIEEDSTRNIAGIYARKIQTAKIGLGDEDSSHIYLIESMMTDDTSSLFQKPSDRNPQSGILSAIDFRINLGKRSFIKGEIAGSLFTRDNRSDETPDFSPSFLTNVFTPKESSRMDYASVVSIGRDGNNFGIKLVGRYYGDGFVPMGYPFLQTDRMEATVDPRFSLFKSRFQFSGSIGKRLNNLSEIRAATTTQTIGSGNVFTQFSDKFSLALSYSNFGFRNSVINDTFRVEMVTESWSISPTFNYRTKTSTHNYTILYAQNTFNDFNIVSGALNDNDAISATLSYMISMAKSPLSASTMVSYFDNNTSYGKLLTKSINITVGYKFLDKKLKTSAGFTFSENKIDDGNPGVQGMTTLRVRYTLKRKINLAVNGSLNVFKYGDSRPGISYRENLLRSSITYKL
jgi:hypothetical protein